MMEPSFQIYNPPNSGMFSDRGDRSNELEQFPEFALQSASGELKGRKKTLKKRKPSYYTGG